MTTTTKKNQEQEKENTRVHQMVLSHLTFLPVKDVLPLTVFWPRNMKLVLFIRLQRRELA